MATIFFGMSGEGRGHATRVRSIVEALRPEGHRLVLFAPGDAYELLAPVYRNTKVKVVRIPGLRFYYNEKRKLDHVSTAAGAFRYLIGMPRLVRKLDRLFRTEVPDLIVTDFEPALPRAARRCGIPFISINHQHFLVVNDLSALPLHLRLHAAFMGFVVRLYYGVPRVTIVSQFYFPPVKPRYRGQVKMAGVLFRPEFLEAPIPVVGGYVLAYVRKFASSNVMASLRLCGYPVKLYGLGERPPEGNIEYCPIDDRQFIVDLANCRALVCTAGNQLVGEALYLRKPVFVLPEANNFEQVINAHYLVESGAGVSEEIEYVRPSQLRAFLDNLADYRARIEPERMNGNPVALEAIHRSLAA